MQKLTPELYRAIIDEARKTTFEWWHTSSISPMRAISSEAGVDGFLHSVRDAEMDDALVARMKERNVYITPNLAIGGRGNLCHTETAWYYDPLLAEVFSPAAIALVRPRPNPNPGARTEARRLYG